MNTCAAFGMSACVEYLVVDGIRTVRAFSHSICQLSNQALGGEVIGLSQTFIVMKNITYNTPRFVVSSSGKEATKYLVFADIIIDTSAKVDALLGTDVVSTVLTGQVLTLGSGLPTTVRTKFVFVIVSSMTHFLCCFFSYEKSLTLLSTTRFCSCSSGSSGFLSGVDSVIDSSTR